jgi:hypothetical protein
MSRATGPHPTCELDRFSSSSADHGSPTLPPQIVERFVHAIVPYSTCFSLKLTPVFSSHPDLSTP